jgi:hypothetical protein
MDYNDHVDALAFIKRHKGIKAFDLLGIGFAEIHIDGIPDMGDLHYSAFTEYGMSTPGYIIDSTATVIEDVPLLAEQATGTFTFDMDALKRALWDREKDDE